MPRSLTCLMSSRTLCNFPHAERCGRLVHNHHFAAPGYRSGDRHALTLSSRESVHRLSHRAQSDIERTDVTLRLAAHGRLVQEPAIPPPLARDLAAKKKISLHIHFWNDGKVLVDGLDAEGAGVKRRVDLDFPPLEPKDAGVRRYKAPDITLTNVDFPAPLSPTRPTISPRCNRNEIPSSAWTAPNRFRMSVSSKSGASPAWITCIQSAARRTPWRRLPASRRPSTSRSIRRRSRT